MPEIPRNLLIPYTSTKNESILSETESRDVKTGTISICNSGTSHTNEPILKVKTLNMMRTHA